MVDMLRDWLRPMMLCRLRSVIARIQGVRWDGHSWDEHPKGVVCVDCGKIEEGTNRCGG